MKNNEEIEAYFKEHKFEGVFHLAAQPLVIRSYNEPVETFETNVLGTSNLLEGCTKFDTNLFFQISTDEVYGSISDGLNEENDRINPSSPYSASKASAELLIQSFGHTYSMNYLIARCSNNYGPCQYPEKFIPVAIKNLISGNQVPVYGTGQNIREWIYVTDTCAALIEILFKGKSGQVYNVSSGEFRSNIDIVNKLCELIGIEENMVNFVADRAGHDFRYAINSNKLRQELGWQTKVKFDDGLNSTINWYKNNFHRFKKW